LLKNERREALKDAKEALHRYEDAEIERLGLDDDEANDDDEARL
jgi:hypothetical protein